MILPGCSSGSRVNASSVTISARPRANRFAPLPQASSAAFWLGITRHARAVQVIYALQDPGKATPDQVKDLNAARRDLNDLRPHASRDAESAYWRDSSLVPEAARGETKRARLAISHERDVRSDPERRAHQDGMRDMARSLERDPQMESILANRKQQLGISFDSGRKLGAELAFHEGFDLGRGRGLGIGM
jgi:FMN phosphatase YigB (HAD superfamily)